MQKFQTQIRKHIKKVNLQSPSSHEEPDTGSEHGRRKIIALRFPPSIMAVKCSKDPSPFRPGAGLKRRRFDVSIFLYFRSNTCFATGCIKINAYIFNINEI